jgi:hypothetical protein
MTTIAIVRKKSPWKRRIGWSALALTGFAACMQWKNSSRRARVENRVLCSELLPIRWQRGEETVDTIGNLEEIWPTGAVISFEEELALDEAVLVTPAKEFRGSVVATWHDETGYFVELRFSSSDAWSMDMFTPEHALDLSAMERRPARADSSVRTSVRLVKVSR